jgi:hypothetical protein
LRLEDEEDIRLLAEVDKRGKGLVFSLSTIKIHPFFHKGAKSIFD